MGNPLANDINDIKSNTAADDVFMVLRILYK